MAVVVGGARAGEARAAQGCRSGVVGRLHVAAHGGRGHASWIFGAAAPLPKLVGLRALLKYGHVKRLRQPGPLRPNAAQTVQRMCAKVGTPPPKWVSHENMRRSLE